MSAIFANVNKKDPRLKWVKYSSSGLEVKKKLEFILKLKIKRNDWLLADKQQIIALYFDFETVLKLYNLEESYFVSSEVR